VRKSVFKAVLLATTAVIGIGCATPGMAREGELLAQASSAQLSFAIPAGPLPGALAAFGERTGLQVLYPADLTRGLASPGVSGTLTPQAALGWLLTGTGLRYRFTNESTVTLEKVAADGAMTLDPVTVEGTASATEESGWGAVKGYVAKRTATGTKTDTPIVEVPQTVNVVTADQIEATKAQTLSDVLAYTPGVVSRQANDHTGDSFTIRGFHASSQYGSFYRDGTKYMVNSFAGQLEPYGFERVEVLKGASSVLLGSAAPGGIINTVTKKPTIDPLHEVNVELGSYDHRQVSADFGGALTEDGQWSYRLTALKRDTDTFVDHVPDDRDYLAPALTWRPDQDTSLTVLGYYQKSRTAYNYGFPAGVTILSNPNGRVSSDTFVGEPGYDHYDGDVYSLGYLFEHAFNDRLTLRNSARYVQSQLDFPAIGISGLAADNRTTAWRGATDRKNRSTGFTTDTSMEFEWRTGPIAHTSLAGVDYTESTFYDLRFSRTAGAIDLYAPSYTGVGNTITPAGAGKSTATRLGAYAQNQMKLWDKVVLVAGGRQDWTEDRSSTDYGKNWTSDHDKAFSGRAGLVYLADNGLAPFISYSESFEPQSGTDRLGASFKPTTGQQYEIGLRYQPPGVNAMVSGTLYELTRQNVTTPDPVAPATFSIQNGEVRSRGFEIEAKAEVTPRLNVMTGYTYTDSRVTESNTAAELGRRNATVPYNQLSLWGDYNLGDFSLPEVTAGLGMRYVDTTLGFTAVKGEVPSYTVFDAMVRYDMDEWRFTVNATNLFDKEYIASCTYACFFGDRRKVVGTLSYRW
jgi:TonB-dependent siderophore receptor